MSFNPLNIIGGLTGGKKDEEIEPREAENASYGDNPYLAPKPKMADPAHVKYVV